MSNSMEMPSFIDHSIEITDEDIASHIRERARDEVINEIRQERFLSFVADLFGEAEKSEIRVSDVVVNVLGYSDIQRLRGTSAYEVEQNEELLGMGLLGYLWGSRVWVTRTQSPRVMKVYRDCLDDQEELRADFPMIGQRVDDIQSEELVELEDSYKITEERRIYEEKRKANPMNKIKMISNGRHPNGEESDSKSDEAKAFGGSNPLSSDISTE